MMWKIGRLVAPLCVRIAPEGDCCRGRDMNLGLDVSTELVVLKMAVPGLDWEILVTFELK